MDKSHLRLQLIIFSLVSAAFTNIYITQPILPVLQNEFSADMESSYKGMSLGIF